MGETPRPRREREPYFRDRLRELKILVRFFSVLKNEDKYIFIEDKCIFFRIKSLVFQKGTYNLKEEKG